MDTDRNLLFGVLALQADLIDAPRFAEACTAWSARKDAPLAQLLVERGWLTPSDRADIEKVLARKLQKHGGDARASLAEVTTDPIKQSLAGLADPDVQQSLAGLATPPHGLVLLATTAYEPGACERYTLSRLHASGGIGRVWLAHDATLGRDVALKELRPERAGNPAVWARFLKEAQVTGQLEHPSIVPIYELGRRPETQQPFYTMRFVRGRTLAEASAAYHRRRAVGEAKPLELRDLLTAFVGVCNAAAYAHSRGVLHRDLKPQNVVLGDYGEVMVLDWGLARLTDRPDDEAPPLELPAEGQTDETMQGQVLGTPAYMAPEQAEGRLDLLGPASDVYGLGAILYEILTGAPPFTGEETVGVLRRVVHEPPARPRSVNASSPAPLEAVCLKALAKKPKDRYASAKELATEVQHWLADEPVTAYAEPLMVRAGRFARRHRTAVAVAAALLVFGVAGLSVAAVLINGQRQKAEDNFKLAQAARAQAEQNFQKAEENFQFAQTAVDDMYTGVAEKWLAQESHMEPVQRDFLMKALHFYEKFADAEGASPEVRMQAAVAQRRVGAIQARLGDVPAAEAAFRGSIATLRALDKVATTPKVRAALQLSLNRYGWLLWSIGKSPDDALREARELGEALAQDPSAPLEAREELATALSVQAIVAMACGRFPDAEAAMGRALPLRETLAREAPTVENREAVGRSHYHLARLLQRVGRYREAETEFGRAVSQAAAVSAGAPREPWPRAEWANDLIERAGLYSLLGRPKDAEADLRRGMELSEALQADFPSVNEYKELNAAMRRDLAALLNDKKQVGDARKIYDAAVADGEALVKEAPDVVSYRWNLAVHLSGLMTLEWGVGRFAEAEKAARRALELADDISAKAPARVDYRALAAHRRFELADLLSNSGKKPEAIPVYEKATAEYESLVRDCPQVPEYRYSLNEILTRMGDRKRVQGDLENAESLYLRALPLAEALAHDFPDVPNYRVEPTVVRTSLTKLAVKRRDPASARRLLEPSLRALDAEQKANPGDARVRSLRVMNLGYLARTQAQEGDAAAAAATARQVEETAVEPMEHFNAACYLSLLFQDVQDAAKPGPERDALLNTLPERSVAQLRKAHEIGLEDLATILGDVDLDPIRTRPEFKAFQSEVSDPKPTDKK
ncbi:MAG TPA: serine/threonine-protein kinase [Gemmataceae bacterium]|nr:serine/threonine-protein kinase [Gemmataceae bacterium]